MLSGAENLISPDQRPSSPLAAPWRAEHPTRHAAVHLHFSHIRNKTVLTASRATSPLRILSPQNPGAAAWVYTSSFGGGLLAGDDLSVNVVVDARATAYLSTQSSTKIYRSDNGLVSRQSLDAKIAEDALLILLPDPVSCFAGARYHQKQRFDLSHTASLVLFDGFTSGRHASGERWAAAEYRTNNEIWLDGTCLLRDRLCLTPGTTRLGMKSLNCLATLILIGPKLEAHAAHMSQQVQRLPVKPNTPVSISASPLAKGLILRAAGPNAESISQTIFSCLAFLTEFLGEAPWSRKW